MRFLMLLAVTTTACIHLPARPYVAPIEFLPGTAKELAAALDDVARAEGWTALSTDGGATEFLGPVTGLIDDVVSRERWRFWLTDYEVRVQLTFEVLLPEVGRWESATEVCDTYGYLRESDKVAKLATRLAASRSTLVAGRPVAAF